MLVYIFPRLLPKFRKEHKLKLKIKQKTKTQLTKKKQKNAPKMLFRISLTALLLTPVLSQTLPTILAPNTNCPCVAQLLSACRAQGDDSSRAFEECLCAPASEDMLTPATCGGCSTEDVLGFRGVVRGWCASGVERRDEHGDMEEHEDEEMENMEEEETDEQATTAIQRSPYAAPQSISPDADTDVNAPATSSAPDITSASQTSSAPTSSGTDGLDDYDDDWIDEEDYCEDEGSMFPMPGPPAEPDSAGMVVPGMVLGVVVVVVGMVV